MTTFSQKDSTIAALKQREISLLEQLKFAVDKNDAKDKQIELYKAGFEVANAKLVEIGQTLYGEGLGVADWHQNGTLEEMDTFFDDNNWSEIDIDEVKEALAATGTN